MFLSTRVTPSAVRVSSSSSPAFEVFETSSLELLNTLSLSDSLSVYSSWLLPATLVERAAGWLAALGSVTRSCRDLLALSLRICNPVVMISSRSWLVASEEEDGCDERSIHESASCECMPVRIRDECSPSNLDLLVL